MNPLSIDGKRGFVNESLTGLAALYQSPYALSSLWRLGPCPHSLYTNRISMHTEILQKIGHLVGHADGWLKRIVRPVVNANLWVHTRSAWMTAPASCRLKTV